MAMSLKKMQSKKKGESKKAVAIDDSEKENEIEQMKRELKSKERN